MVIHNELNSFKNVWYKFGLCASMVFAQMIVLPAQQEEVEPDDSKINNILCIINIKLSEDS